MRTITTTLVLPEGTLPAKVDIIERSDLPTLKNIYTLWRNLCKETSSLNARNINLPDALSECSFCYFFNCWRTKYPIPGATHASFDAYNPINNSRIQIKGCSKNPDLTSFGPKSVWDELFFLDFYKEGKWDFTFDVYLIPNNFIRTQTFVDLQKQNRRPRFSIIDDIIKPHKLQPQYTCNIETGTVQHHF